MNRNNLLNPLCVFAGVLLLITAVGFTGPGGRVMAGTSNIEIHNLFTSSFEHEGSGETRQALNDILNILRLDPDNYTANLRAGWLYYLEGRYGDSVAFYEKTSNIMPSAIEPKLGLMLPLMATDRWPEAGEAGRDILDRAPGNYTAASRLAYIYFAQAKYRQAEEVYKGLIEYYPADLDMILGLGWTYARLGRRTEARRLFEAVLVIRSTNISARSGLDFLAYRTISNPK